MNILMRDIGDGLNMYIDHSMMVDYGSQQTDRLKCRCDDDSSSICCCRQCYHFRGVKTFVLSHFHTDHYNGLFLCSNKHCFMPCWDLDHVYYAGMPVLGDKQTTIKFYSALLAVCHYILGDKSGIASVDLITRLQGLNNKEFYYAPLFKGDSFKHNRIEYEVLWPPRELQSKKILKRIKDALCSLDEILKEKPQLKELYEKYSGIVDKMTSNVSDKDVGQNYPNGEMNQSTISKENDCGSVVIDSKDHGKISNEVKTVNKALRSVANDLSLAFKTKYDKKLLFMGDLETNQINTVCDQLKGRHFEVFITPHHGTHSGKNMKLITADVALSSVGQKLYQKHLTNPHLNVVVNHALSTHQHGCLRIGTSRKKILIKQCRFSVLEKL